MTQSAVGSSNRFSATLVCPKDRGPLFAHDTSLECRRCGSVFPLVRGVPILINDDNSVFAVSDYVETPGYEGASYARDWDRVGGGETVSSKDFQKIR